MQIDGSWLTKRLLYHISSRMFHIFVIFHVFHQIHIFLHFIQVSNHSKEYGSCTSWKEIMHDTINIFYPRSRQITSNECLICLHIRTNILRLCFYEVPDSELFTFELYQPPSFSLSLSLSLSLFQLTFP